MRKGAILFLKVTVVLIGLVVLFLSTFMLPKLAVYTAELNPAFAYLKYPVLIGVYVTTLPFFFALYRALILLNFIRDNDTFQNTTINILKSIKYCAVAIGMLYSLGGIILMTQNALHPGIALIGTAIIVVTLMVIIVITILHSLLKNAIHYKAENDLTV